MKRAMLKRWYLRFGAGVLALSISNVACADDAAVQDIGGTLIPMHGHPSVRMLSEEVHIQLPEGHVEARFRLRNEGPATTVLIGFPDAGNGYQRGRIWSFRSWVDGRRARVRRVGRVFWNTARTAYQFWWVKSVHFARGQTRILEEKYRGGRLSMDEQEEEFQYILKTGASWKGLIGHARIVCNVPPVRGGGRWNARPQGFRCQGNVLIWDLFRAKPRDDIAVTWVNGFTEMVVDGEYVSSFEKETGVRFYTEGNELPQRRCIFRSKTITDSGPKRSYIPLQSDH